MLCRLFGSSRKKNAKKNDSKRSKSCDRELEGCAQSAQGVHKNIKSASSSPLKRADRRRAVSAKTPADKIPTKPVQSGVKLDGSTTTTRSTNNTPQATPDSEVPLSSHLLTPSTLSLATEWEFLQACRQDDQINGNENETAPTNTVEEGTSEVVDAVINHSAVMRS